MAKNETDEERRRGYWEGKIDAKLASIDSTLKTLCEEHKDFKKDIQNRVTENTETLATQKGWVAGIGCACGVFGTVLTFVGREIIARIFGLK